MQKRCKRDAKQIHNIYAKQMHNRDANKICTKKMQNYAMDAKMQNVQKMLNVQQKMQKVLKCKKLQRMC